MTTCSDDVTERAACAHDE